MNESAKILTIDQFKAFKEFQNLGKIVMTSGGYDPIHPGHLSCILESKNFGETLVILVNGDNFLIQKKGRPFMNLETRCRILSCIKGVDYVIPFETSDGDTTVIKALKEIKPDVFTKGGDRTDEKSIPEAKICKKLNIALLTGVGEEKKWSSSDFLQQWSDFILDKVGKSPIKLSGEAVDVDVRELRQHRDKLKGMTIPRLKKLCEKLGLYKTGSKPALIGRVNDYFDGKLKSRKECFVPTKLQLKFLPVYFEHSDLSLKKISEKSGIAYPTISKWQQSQQFKDWVIEEAKKAGVKLSARAGRGRRGRKKSKGFEPTSLQTRFLETYFKLAPDHPTLKILSDNSKVAYPTLSKWFKDLDFKKWLNSKAKEAGVKIGRRKRKQRDFRPTKLQEKFRDIYLKFLDQGKTNEQLAKLAGIGVSTLSNWRKDMRFKDWLRLEAKAFEEHKVGHSSAISEQL